METGEARIAEFKERVEKEWAGDDTAAAWQKYYPELKEQLAELTRALVDTAAPRPGMFVLDLASGTGEPSLSLARGVAPGGKVVATDLSSGMLNAVKQNASAEGVTNVETRVVDAHSLPFPDASFDLVTSRFGVMFFANIAQALGEIKRVLKPGGAIAFMVWGPPTPGSYFETSAMPYIRRLPVKPDPDGPGPMRFAEPGKLVRLIEAAGFGSVKETSMTFAAAYRGTPEQLLTAMMEIAAPFRNAAASLSPEARQAAESEALENRRRLYDGTFTKVTAPVLILTARSNA